jgi:hypothetical protein
MLIAWLLMAWITDKNKSPVLTGFAKNSVISRRTLDFIYFE